MSPLVRTKPANQPVVVARKETMHEISKFDDTIESRGVLYLF